MPRVTREQFEARMRDLDYEVTMGWHSHEFVPTIRAYADQLEADLRAADELAELQDKLLVAYRTGLQPSVRVLDRLPVVRAACRARREQDA